MSLTRDAKSDFRLQTLYPTTGGVSTAAQPAAVCSACSPPGMQSGLSWRANEGIWWRKTDIRDLWPSSLVELFENDETVRKSPTEVKRTRSARGDGGAEKESTAGERAVGTRRPKGGGQKSRCMDTAGTTEARPPADIRPPGGTRSVDPMPARGRATSASKPPRHLQREPH